MKKGLLVVMVLAAWVLLRNQTYSQLFASNQNNVQQKAQIVAQTISKNLFQFTSVHLYAIELKTKKKLKQKKLRICRATNEKQPMNHDPLLIINGL